MSYSFINCLITLQDGHSVLLINQKYMYENINFPVGCFGPKVNPFVFKSVKMSHFSTLRFPDFSRQTFNIEFLVRILKYYGN